MQAPSELALPTVSSLERLPQLLAEAGTKKWVYLSDHHVTPLLNGRLAGCPMTPSRSGPVTLENGWITVPAGESSKQIETAIHIWNCLAAAAIDRQWTLVAVGGGMVGDLAGFVASTYLRGLSFVQIPTSLLAMVDSSIGGKVGIDLPSGKNLVGSFWPARLIVTDPSLLSSLPEAEWSSGMAEVIKHAVLDGEDHLRWLESLAPEKVRASAIGANAQPSLAQQLVERSLQVKVEVVTQDPYEKGVRAHLNFGHTLGHAIEQALHYQGISHGQAVALGMVAATRIAIGRSLCEEQLLDRLQSLIERWGLPTSWSDLHTAGPIKPAWEFISTALLRDKKNQNGQVRFVLPLAPENGRRPMRLEAVSLDEIHPIYQSL